MVNLLKNKQLENIEAESGLISIDQQGQINRRLKFSQIKNGLPALFE